MVEDHYLTWAFAGNMIADMGNVLKRRVVKVFLAIFVLVGIVLGLFAVLTRDWGPEVPFDFLAGRTLTANPVRSVYGPTTVIYSFEGDFADFNDVCTKADSELLPMGFRVFPPIGVIPIRTYLLPSTAADTCALVSISYRQEIEAHSTAKSSEYSTPNRYTSHDKNGSVSVRVAGTPRRPWWPRHLLRRLQAMLRRTTSNPPAKKLR